MTVGLPGVGLGGIFYLVSALTMPVRELARTVRGESSALRWRLVARQWLLAIGILVAMWFTGKAIGVLVASVGLRAASSGVGRGIASRNVLQVSALALSLGTLSLVWLTVHGLRILVRWRGRVPQTAVESTSDVLELSAAPDPRTYASRGSERGPDSGQFRWSS